MLALKRKVGETLVLRKPAAMTSPLGTLAGTDKFRIVITLEEAKPGLAAVSLTITGQARIERSSQQGLSFTTTDGDAISVLIDAARGSSVSFAIDAPPAVVILRGELEQRQRSQCEIRGSAAASPPLSMTVCSRAG